MHLQTLKFIIYIISSWPNVLIFVMMKFQPLCLLAFFSCLSADMKKAVLGKSSIPKEYKKSVK